MKWGRTYTMKIQGQTQEWMISYPMTCRFLVDFAGTPMANHAHFIVYNLQEQTRSDITKDLFTPYIHKTITFSAGYLSEPYIPQLFSGDVWTCYSYREGPDWMTEIDALDLGLGIQTAQINLSLPSGWTLAQIVQSAVQAMSGATYGAVSQFEANNHRGFVYGGDPWTMLKEIAAPLHARLFSINGSVYLLNQQDYISIFGTQDLIISGDTGMIGSPKQVNEFTKVEMLLEPRLYVGQEVELQSEEPLFNGKHHVYALNHRGTISDAVCEDARTSATFVRTPEGEAIVALIGGPS